MSRQKSREQTKRRTEKKSEKKRMLLLLTMVLSITVGSIVFGSIFSSAQPGAEESERVYKYYKSIRIEKGDSLWSIAQEYVTDAYGDTREYIDELKEINNLTSDQIHQGQYLVVAYYDTEFR